MYNPSEISTIIKLTAQNRKITVKKMLEDCKINKGFIYDLEHKSSYPSCDKIYRIADYFDCSVDYLLGRSDTPNMSNSVDNSVLINGSINNSNHSTLNVATPPQDEMTQQLIDGFKTLSFENKLKIMNTLFELKKES